MGRQSGNISSFAPFLLVCIVSIILLHNEASKVLFPAADEQNMQQHSKDIIATKKTREQKTTTTTTTTTTLLDDDKYKEITFTNYGWFHDNASTGLQSPRSLTSRDLVDAIVSDERYNASSWDDLDSHPNPNRPIIAVLDVETCKDVHWPRFGQDSKMASDVEGGRTPMVEYTIDRGMPCQQIEDALRSPAMAAPQSRLVILSCWEDSTHICHRNRTESTKLVVVHLSAHKSHVNPENDFGISPLPVKPVTLNDTQLESIEKCSNKTQRKHIFSFMGRRRVVFPEFHRYFEQMNGRDGVQAIFKRDHYAKHGIAKSKHGLWVIPKVPVEEQAEDFYLASAMDAVFAGAPRGDSLTSVRFPEVLSAGAIPVVYADGWVLPFTKDVVDWSNFSVLLPQKDVRQTLQILKSISPRERCEMQRKALWAYKEYVADSKARLRGILKVLDSRLQGSKEKVNVAPGDEYFGYDDKDFSDSYWDEFDHETKESAKLLGFTKELWDNESKIPIYSTPLEDLGPREKATAINLGVDGHFATKPVTAAE